MTTDGTMRASDHDRESAVEVLRDAYTAGRLNLDEFDERTTAAYAAKTWGDLRELTSDLPTEPLLGADLHPLTPKPEVTGAPMEYRAHRPPFVPLLPIALVWLVIAVAAHTPAIIIPIVLLCLMSVRVAGWRRRHPPQDRGPSQHTHGSSAPRTDDLL